MFYILRYSLRSSFILWKFWTIWLCENIRVHVLDICGTKFWRYSSLWGWWWTIFLC